jgi:hypothetical protein
MVPRVNDLMIFPHFAPLQRQPHVGTGILHRIDLTAMMQKHDRAAIYFHHLPYILGKLVLSQHANLSHTDLYRLIRNCSKVEWFAGIPY